jgi:predicted porin
MKNKLLAVLATFGMVATASAVKINNNISINGFIDGSYHNVDLDGVETSDLELDEVELNFLVNAGNVSGELHIDNNGDDNELNIEQVHFTYSFGNGADLTVGRFGSALGFEREDPAGLYTFSRAYDANFNFGDIDTVGAQEGLRVGYSAGDFAASLSLYNQVGDDLKQGNPSLSDDLDYEVAISYTGIDNLTVGLGIQNTREGEVAAPAVQPGDEEAYVINAGYTLNKLLLAGEYANTEVDGADDLSAYMILADYDVNDKLGFAVRYSNWESVDADSGNIVETDKLTFAPNYAITDSLGAIIEFSAEETGDVETDSFAVELTYTF